MVVGGRGGRESRGKYCVSREHNGCTSPHPTACYSQRVNLTSVLTTQRHAGVALKKERDTDAMHATIPLDLQTDCTPEGFSFEG